jgi:hypothetical protein
MPFVVHVVEQSDGFPKIDIFTAQLGKVFHRIRDRVTMFSQTFRLDPFVKNSESTRGLGHGKKLKSTRRKQSLNFSTTQRCASFIDDVVREN